MQQRAVITGANSGIGLATALRLATDGYQVFAGARRTEGIEAIDDAASAAGVERHRDDELLGSYFLEGDGFRERYGELSEIDYRG